MHLFLLFTLVQINKQQLCKNVDLVDTQCRIYIGIVEDYFILLFLFHTFLNIEQLLETFIEALTRVKKLKTKS